MPDAVHYLGIDLAWGERNPTGVAVLDADARLRHVSTVRTDDDISAALAPYLPGSVAGLDAPLVVTNPTGSRPAEKALSRDFRRYEAGTHPANTAMPHFAAGTRGARVAARLGLVTHVSALEVYPHAATVALFGLDRTLKYKAKPGRTLESLRGEMLRLWEYVDGLIAGGPAWAALREAVVGASRKSALRVVEDQLDAVVCAYVALLADRSPEQVTTYGDPETGQIVTPSLSRVKRRVEPPVDDNAAVSADPIRAAVQEYAARHAELELAAARAVEVVGAILDEGGIDYQAISGRAKTVASFAEKAGRLQDGAPLYPDPLRDIGDQIGIRVITYVRRDVEVVAALLEEQLVVHDDRDLGQLTASEGRFGYASRHLQVAVDRSRAAEPDNAVLRGRVVQVQVRTVLQHAWAEFEHDIRYKGTVPDEHASEFDRRFTLAAGLLELADHEFSAIRDRLRGSGPATSGAGGPDADPRIAPRELGAFLAGQFPDAGWSRTDHYAWISGLLLELGITSFDELGDVVRGADEEAIGSRMDYRYPPGAVRRLDDALLATYGDRYLALHGNAHREEALRTRLARLQGE